MLIRSLVSLVLVASLFLSACESTTDVTNPLLEITPGSEFTLTGGGWRVEGQDTLIAYSTDISYTVKSSRTDEAIMKIGLEIGAMVNGSFTTDPQFVLVDTASLNAINNQLFIIGGSRSSFVFTADHIVIGRPKNAGWSYPYAWRVRYNDGMSDVEKTGTFKGSEQSNRWRGVLMTMEHSPEPVGVFDAPDDGDWLSTHPLLSQVGAYANPASSSRSFEITYTLAQAVDSVVAEYLETPTRVTNRVIYKALTAGAWSESIVATGLPLGLGRMRIRAYSGSTMAESHGDIYIYEE